MYAHEYGTQPRRYVIALGSDWSTHTSHHTCLDITSYHVINSPGLAKNNHHE